MNFISIFAIVGSEKGVLKKSLVLIISASEYGVILLCMSMNKSGMLSAYIKDTKIILFLVCK